MASSPRQQRKQKPKLRIRNASLLAGRLPVGWLVLTFLLYVAIGTVLAAFPIPGWVWGLAIGGVVTQTFALAGPTLLRRYGWWQAQGLSLAAILGTSAIAIALGIALGFVGTDNIDDLTVGSTVLETLRMGGVAFIMAALGAIVSARTGDRLLSRCNHLQTGCLLALVGLSGVGLGAVIGLLVVL